MAPRDSPALSQAFAAALQSRSERHLRRSLTLPPSQPACPQHDFSSNDFLSLSRHPGFRARFLAYVAAHCGPDADTEHEESRQLRRLHPQGLASGGSRLLDGNSAFAESLEAVLARFHQAPRALLFNSGYDANVGVLSCVPQPGDAVVYDALAHASIHDGLRLSRVPAHRRLPFAHNAPADLAAVLRRLVSRDAALRDGRASVFVAIESVYSMDGDVAPVAALADVVDEVLPRRNGYLVVDEAHATGVFGPKGAGVVQALGQQDRVFIRVHTFGKALASHGAVVLCDDQTRDYLINYARSLIYSTALPFAALASVRTAYELLDSTECDQLRSRLDRLIHHCHNALVDIAAATADTPLPRPTTTTTVSTRPASHAVVIRHEPGSPIFSLITPLALELAEFCQARGFMVRAVRPPTVPKGTERVRLCLHAGNTFEGIDGFAAAVKDWLRNDESVLSRL